MGCRACPVDTEFLWSGNGKPYFSSMDSTRVSPESGKDRDRLQQLREDISRRLRHLISDWPHDEQAAIIEKIAQTELRFPPEPFVKEFESMRKTDRG